jgi:DNA polymerase-3 subunit epsilon
MNTPSDAELAAAEALLQASPDHRVLRRLAHTDTFVTDAAGPLASAVVVDTETTGTARDTDRIVELAMVRFDYLVESGEIVRITQVYSGLEDPGFPIPPASTAIHGITDAMVAGKHLDEAAVIALLDGVTLVVAHNAGFDRPFLEARLPVFATVPWGCSWAQIPWEEEGFPGSKLEYLCWASGFFFDAHRSETDCRALLELLRRPLPRSGVIGFKRLLDASREPSLRLWATRSPFETKDLLKERGYRWDAERRCWHRTLPRAAALEESEWLKSAVYGGKAAQIEVEVLDAKILFSGRPGPVKTRVL